MRKTELLVPANNLEVLKTAVIYGADAVYIGGEVFGLRAKAKNFTLDEMAQGIEFAHLIFTLTVIPSPTGIMAVVRYSLCFNS